MLELHSVDRGLDINQRRCKCDRKLTFYSNHTITRRLSSPTSQSIFYVHFRFTWDLYATRARVFGATPNAMKMEETQRCNKERSPNLPHTQYACSELFETCFVS